MAIFFNLLTSAFSCILYGCLTTVVIMILLFFLLRTLSEGIVKSIPFYITGVILAFFQVCNFSIIAGAFQVKNATESMEISIRQLTENPSGIVNANESQEVFDFLLKEYPLLGSYLQIANFSGNEISELATTIPQVIGEEMNSVIWTKLWWSIGYIVVACVIAVLFEKKVYKSPGDSWQKEYYTDI